MKLILGSLSESKVNIVRNYFLKFTDKEVIVDSCDVPSGVNSQPIGEPTIIKGAINRAKRALKNSNEQTILGIGLEAGLVRNTITPKLYDMVCVCILVDRKEQKYLGISGKVPLPFQVSVDVSNGDEFGNSIRNYMEEHKGDLIVKTDLERLVDRNRDFTEALDIAYRIYLNKDHYNYN